MGNPSLEALAAFFAGAEVARRATRPLSPQAEVGLSVAGEPARFTMAGGAPAILSGPAVDPDFTLTLPAAAVERLTGAGLEKIGELGVEFLRLAADREASRHIGIRLHAPTTRLLARGYLVVLLLGGAAVALWLLRRGIADPRAAIDRLRGR